MTDDMRKRDLSRKHSSGSKAGVKRADSRAAEDKNVRQAGRQA